MVRLTTGSAPASGAAADASAGSDDSSTGSSLILVRGKSSSAIFILLKVLLVISSPVAYRARRFKLRLFSASNSLKIPVKIIGKGME